MASAATPHEDPSVTSDSADPSTDNPHPRKKLKTAEEPTASTFSDTPSLVEILELQREFIRERDWDKFHTPRNVVLDMVAEVGELAEIFQWKGEVQEGLPGWSDKDREHLGEELSDVLLTVINLADRCRVDLPRAVLEKLEKNRRKYPKEKAFGSAKKYTEYQ